MNTALALRSTRLIPSLFPLQDMVDEAVVFLREYEPPEGYFVGFSGGKDSIVTLELCRMAGVQHQAYYSCTGIDAPEVVQFIRQHYPDMIWLYPEMTFWQGIRKKSPPLCNQRWCCDTLKKDPSKNIPLLSRVMGIRAEESNSRAERGRVCEYIVRKGRGKNKKGRLVQTRIHPIFHWKEWHVWEFIDANNLPYPCLYDEGFDRIGCVVCPFILHKNQAKLNRHKTRWPSLYHVFERVVTDWYLHHSTRATHDQKTPEEYLAAYYRGFELSDAGRAALSPLASSASASRCRPMGPGRRDCTTSRRPPMPELPCTTHGVTTCPYLCTSLEGRESWTCCGVQGEGPRRLVLVRECPRVDAAREVWRKNQAMKKAGA